MKGQPGWYMMLHLDARRRSGTAPDQHVVVHDMLYWESSEVAEMRQLFKCCLQAGRVLCPRGGGSRAMESALLALAQGRGPAQRIRSADGCRLYNERRCNFKNCKYRHACRWCGGGHAGCDCRSSGRPEPGPCAMITPEAQEERLLPIRSDMELVGRGNPIP